MGVLENLLLGRGALQLLFLLVGLSVGLEVHRVVQILRAGERMGNGAVTPSVVIAILSVVGNVYPVALAWAVGFKIAAGRPQKKPSILKKLDEDMRQLSAAAVNKLEAAKTQVFSASNVPFAARYSSVLSFFFSASTTPSIMPVTTVVCSDVLER